ncbi:hypothetical protein E3N88_27919 [Mikania micrantha]|uniref:Uncharacterized protein n=1 Tax=Mikania micrantha TaxID=192012 RepID=A0A5N6MY42_9ASTR|nr:hypothetical protein E3N88_27919 [Mikania micrantha]
MSNSCSSKSRLSREEAVEDRKKSERGDRRGDMQDVAGDRGNRRLDRQRQTRQVRTENAAAETGSRRGGRREAREW